MTLIDAFNMRISPDSFRSGVTAIRNAREWAKIKRAESIAAANVRM